MTWADVLRRDLTSVYRSKTGTGVTALLAVCTTGAVGLLALTNTTVGSLALLGTVLAAGAVVALVFLGSPRSVAGAVVVFACFAVGMALLFPNLEPYHDPPDADVVAVGIGSVLSFALPLVALLGTYASLAGERETGSVRFLFGLPNSRDDAYLGKYLSRSVLVGVPLVGGLLGGAVVAALTFQPGAWLALLALAVVSVPYALLFVGAGVSASAVADSENQAVALVVAVFVLFRAVWPAIQWLGLQGLRDQYPRPEWFFWIGRLNPMNAYVKLTTLFVGPDTHHPLVTRPDEPLATVATTHWFALVVLLAWTAVAPVLGLLYYRQRDIL